MDRDRIVLFGEIFSGRQDCYGEGEGNCVKELVTDEVICDHLHGIRRIGIYPIIDSNMTNWLVVDVDDNDIEKAKAIRDKLGEYGIQAQVEKSKSKGYHIWIWFSSSVEAKKARVLANYIVKELNCSKIEIFPKQDELSEDKPFGNYVNLPFFGKDMNEGKTVFLDPNSDYQPYADQWTLLGAIERVSPDKLEELIGSMQVSRDTSAGKRIHISQETDQIGLDMVLICPFIVHCKDNAAELPEPLWYAMISNLCRFDGGRDIIHEYSMPYPNYSQSETDKKIDHAIKDTGPHTCQWIRDNGFDCPWLGKCEVKSPAGLAYIMAESEPTRIDLHQIEDGAFEGKYVTTELMIAGTGATYGVPKDVIFYWQDQEDDKAIDKSKEFTIPMDSKLLLDCHKQGDSQLNALLSKALLKNKPGSARVRVESRYTLRELLAVPKIQRHTQAGNGKVNNQDYKNFMVYLINDGDVNNTMKENAYYQATGIALSEPKRQMKTMLITDLVQLDSPWHNFILTPGIEEQFRHFKPVDNTIESIRAKLEQIKSDVTRNITKRYGTHRERMLLINLLVMSSPISCCFDGETKPGWIEVMIIGDTAQAKTTLLLNIMNAINLGQFVCGTSTSRTGLIYSLDTKVDDKRIIVWGAFALNNGGFIAIDEAHKLALDEWSELTEVRSRGEIDVNRAVRGRHPAEVRQIYLANPPSDRPMAHFYHGIEAIKGMMRAEDIRRFDLVVIVAKGDDDGDDRVFLKLDNEWESVPQIFTPEILRNHVCWTWQLSGENVRWTPEAKLEVKGVSEYLYSKYGGSTDIPLVVTDIRDKVCKFAQAVAALLHSTTDNPNQLLILPQHVQIVRDEVFDAVYSHDNCRLDEYAKSARKETDLTNEDYQAILEDIQTIRKGELDSSNTDTLLEAFRNSNLLSLSDLIDILNLQKSSVTNRISILKKHGLVKSSKKEYYKTPKFIAFIRRLDSDIKTANSE
jgi:hypothetical protein